MLSVIQPNVITQSVMAPFFNLLARRMILVEHLLFAKMLLEQMFECNFFHTVLL